MWVIVVNIVGLNYFIRFNDQQKPYLGFEIEGLADNATQFKRKEIAEFRMKQIAHTGLELSCKQYNLNNNDSKEKK